MSIGESIGLLLSQYHAINERFYLTATLEFLDVRCCKVKEDLRNHMLSCLEIVPVCLDESLNAIQRIRLIPLRILLRQWEWLARHSVAETISTLLEKSQVDIRMMYFWIESIRSLSLCTLEGEAATSVELSPYIDLYTNTKREEDEIRRKIYLSIWLEVS